MSIIEFFKIQPSSIGNIFFTIKLGVFHKQVFAHIDSVPLKRRNFIGWFTSTHWNENDVKFILTNSGNKWLSHNKTKSFPNIKMKLGFPHYRFSKTWFCAIFRAKMKQAIFREFHTQRRFKIGEAQPLKIGLSYKKRIASPHQDFDCNHSTLVEMR